MASAKADHLVSKVVVTSEHSIPCSNVSSEQMTLPSLSDTQATLTSVSSDFADGVPEVVTLEEALHVDGTGSGSVHGEDTNNEESAIEKVGPICKERSLTGEEKELPTAEDSNMAFDNIIEFLNVDKPEVSNGSATANGHQSSFDEFKELLNNPEKLHQHEEEIKFAVKSIDFSDDISQSEGENSQIASSAALNSTSSYPDVLKSTACQDSLLNQPEGENENELITECIELSETKWPDIGTDTSRKVPETSTSDKCDLAEAVTVKTTLSNEHCQSDGQQPDVQLLMPSALADLDGSNLNTELSNSTPDLLDETSSEVKHSLEFEDGTMKTKPKSRKRSKKGKAKQNVGPPTHSGIAEVLDVPR